MLRTRKVQMYLLLTLLAFSTFTVRAHAYSVNVQLTGAGGAEYGLGSNYADGEYVMPYYIVSGPFYWLAVRSVRVPVGLGDGAHLNFGVDVVAAGLDGLAIELQ